MAPDSKVTHTYVAALQHDLADIPADATLVGVVRRPTGWFRPAVDENHPALGPPSALLDEFKERHEAFTMQGLCDEGAHNAAWEAVDFEGRYAEYLNTDEDARAALEDLRRRLRSGESLALVCFENSDKKRCHRTILAEKLNGTGTD